VRADLDAALDRLAIEPDLADREDLLEWCAVARDRGGQHFGDGVPGHLVMTHTRRGPRRT